MEAIIVALITGALSILGTVITVNASQQRTQTAMQTEIAVVKTRIDLLAGKVDKHNNFAERVPALETDVKTLKDTTNRLAGLHLEKG